MKTIILDITNDITELLSTQKVFNNMVRYSYNRLVDNNSLKEKDLRKLINEIYSSNQVGYLNVQLKMQCTSLNQIKQKV